MQKILDTIALLGPFDMDEGAKKEKDAKKRLESLLQGRQVLSQTSDGLLRAKKNMTDLWHKALDSGEKKGDIEAAVAACLFYNQNRDAAKYIQNNTFDIHTPK